jgi:hypothetical protein
MASAILTNESTKTTAIDPWFAETTALLLTGLALDLIENGPATGTDMSDEVDLLWLDLDAENKAAFQAFLELTESPASGWSTWLWLVTHGTPVEFDAPVSDEPRPTAEDRYEPTDAETAEYLAMVAKREAREEVMAGWAAESDSPDWVAAFADPTIRVHHAELAECGYRQGAYLEP